MSLGAGVYKASNWLGNALARERKPWEQPPQGIVTLNHSVEYLTTNTYLGDPLIDIFYFINPHCIAIT